MKDITYNRWKNTNLIDMRCSWCWSSIAWLWSQSQQSFILLWSETNLMKGFWFLFMLNIIDLGDIPITSHSAIDCGFLIIIEFVYGRIFTFFVTIINNVSILTTITTYLGIINLLTLCSFAFTISWRRIFMLLITYTNNMFRLTTITTWSIWTCNIYHNILDFKTKISIEITIKNLTFLLHYIWKHFGYRWGPAIKIFDLKHYYIEHLTHAKFASLDLFFLSITLVRASHEHFFVQKQIGFGL